MAASLSPRNGSHMPRMRSCSAKRRAYNQLALHFPSDGSAASKRISLVEQPYVFQYCWPKAGDETSKKNGASATDAYVEQGLTHLKEQPSHENDFTGTGLSNDDGKSKAGFKGNLTTGDHRYGSSKPKSDGAALHAIPSARLRGHDKDFASGTKLKGHFAAFEETDDDGQQDKVQKVPPSRGVLRPLECLQERRSISILEGVPENTAGKTHMESGSHNAPGQNHQQRSQRHDLPTTEDVKDPTLDSDCTGEDRLACAAIRNKPSETQGTRRISIQDANGDASIVDGEEVGFLKGPAARHAPPAAAATDAVERAEALIAELIPKRFGRRLENCQQKVPCVTVGLGPPQDVADLIAQAKARQQLTEEHQRALTKPIPAEERAALKAEIAGLKTKAQNYYLLYQQLKDRQEPLELEIVRLQKEVAQLRENTRHATSAIPLYVHTEKAIVDQQGPDNQHLVRSDSYFKLLETLLNFCRAIKEAFVHLTPTELGGGGALQLERAAQCLHDGSHLHPSIEKMRRELLAALRTSKAAGGEEVQATLNTRCQVSESRMVRPTTAPTTFRPVTQSNLSTSHTQGNSHFCDSYDGFLGKGEEMPKCRDLSEKPMPLAASPGTAQVGRIRRCKFSTFSRTSKSVSPKRKLLFEAAPLDISCYFKPSQKHANACLPKSAKLQVNKLKPGVLNIRAGVAIGDADVRRQNLLPERLQDGDGKSSTKRRSLDADKAILKHLVKTVSLVPKKGSSKAARHNIHPSAQHSTELADERRDQGSPAKQNRVLDPVVVAVMAPGSAVSKEGKPLPTGKPSELLPVSCKDPNTPALHGAVSPVSIIPPLMKAEPQPTVVGDPRSEVSPKLPFITNEPSKQDVSTQEKQKAFGNVGENQKDGFKPSAVEEPKPLQIRISHIEFKNNDGQCGTAYRILVHSNSSAALDFGVEAEGVSTERHTARIEPKGGPPKICNIEENLTIPEELALKGCRFSIIEIEDEKPVRLFGTSEPFTPEKATERSTPIEIHVLGKHLNSGKVKEASLIATMARGTPLERSILASSVKPSRKSSKSEFISEQTTDGSNRDEAAAPAPPITKKDSQAFKGNVKRDQSEEGSACMNRSETGAKSPLDKESTTEACNSGGHQTKSTSTNSEGSVKGGSAPQVDAQLQENKHSRQKHGKEGKDDSSQQVRSGEEAMHAKNRKSSGDRHARRKPEDSRGVETKSSRLPVGNGERKAQRPAKLQKLLLSKGFRLHRRKAQAKPSPWQRLHTFEDPEVRRLVQKLVDSGIWEAHDAEHFEIEPLNPSEHEEAQKPTKEEDKQRGLVNRLVTAATGMVKHQISDTKSGTTQSKKPDILETHGKQGEPGALTSSKKAITIKSVDPSTEAHLHMPKVSASNRNEGATVSKKDAGPSRHQTSENNKTTNPNKNEQGSKVAIKPIPQNSSGVSKKQQVPQKPAMDTKNTPAQKEGPQSINGKSNNEATTVTPSKQAKPVAKPVLSAKAKPVTDAGGSGVPPSSKTVAKPPPVKALPLKFKPKFPPTPKPVEAAN